MRLALLTLVALAACRVAPPEKEPCGAVVRFRDADGDGFGDPAASFETCTPERGVDNDDDCDDTNPDIHPDAAEDCAVAVDNNCDGSVGYADDDSDGVPACEDCDDADAARFPGAAETCDGVDQDCDGAVDEEPGDGVTYYPDADGDGFGSIAGGASACEAPAGWLAEGTDCDDADAAVHPDAVEVCDEVDNDCDGATDDPTAADAPTWYRDRDGDGFGNDETAVLSCEAPAAFVADGGDCDDADAATHPAAAEVCNGADDDCDGADDDDATDASEWFLDADADGHGDPAAIVLGCELPEGAAAAGDDCDDADGDVFPGAPESCDAIDQDCDGEVDEAPADGPAWYADLDGDGYGGGAAVVSCTAPEGAVASGGDCDDGSAAVWPEATEACNGADDDCDGATDEDGAAGASTWYADADGDGFGDAAAPRSACARPDGYVADATDCDDADAGANEAGSWYADVDGDGFGDGSVAITACDAPAGYVASALDCDDASPAHHPGAPEADCDDPEDYNCDGSVGLDDDDGDGFAACEECDDRAAGTHPAADEVCNGVDDDCSGAVDDDAIGAAEWHADADGDGYGSPAAVVDACDPPDGYVADATDCDDAVGTTHPGATETCATDADDDCDGTTNERNAEACTRFYFDYDGDGAGSTSSACYCEPTGYLTAATSDDCDDGDGAVSPGHAERWDNGVDDDCDGVVDTVSAATAADGAILGVAASDSAGGALAAVGDVDGDGYDDLFLGATGADSGGVGSGSAYLVRGPVSGSLGLADAEAELTGAAAGDAAGSALAAGDFDGDGVIDLAVGAPNAGGGAGVASLVYGPVSGVRSLSSDDVTWTGATIGDNAGGALASGGDLDGDGVDDLVVGAHQADAGPRDGGAAYVVGGLTVGSSSLSAAAATLTGEAGTDYAGHALSVVGDVDGDGVADLLVGAYGEDAGGPQAGAAYLVLGPVSGTIGLDRADAKLVGEAPRDQAGFVVAGPGDLDDDGLDDLLVSAPQNGERGRVYIVTNPTGVVSLADAAASLSGPRADIEAGSSVAGVGDIDGDGFIDLLVGAPAWEEAGANTGIAWLEYGPFSGARGLGEGAIFEGDGPSGLGNAVLGAGDLDGDGRPDFAIAAEGADTADVNAGATYLFLAP